MNILALIPARMGSSRFPGKPMAKILGKPMIGHVYERVSKCDLLIKTVVATCDQEILEYIESIGGEAVMTSNHHERASDRCAEALGYLEKQNGVKYDIIVMVQGDEPMTHPNMITEAVAPMLDDPTSNLDAESECIFNEALLRIKKEIDITIIIVSHRLDSISNADKIIVLNKGLVASEGTHSELMKQKGWYADAWKMQSVSSDKIN